MRNDERIKGERLLNTASKHVLCEPDDVTPQPPHLALWVEVAGDISITDEAGTTLPYAAVPKGPFLLQGHIIRNTGTTATIYLWS
jgi:hypothetical protein